MYVEERRSQILQHLEKNGSVDVVMLASQMQVSRETIRRDLKDLDSQGLLVKTHGGAIANRNSVLSTNIPYVNRMSSNAEGKDAVAALAAEFVGVSDHVFLDTSTTVARIIKYLDREMRLSFLTNSVQVLVEVAKIKPSNWTVIAMGGELNTGILSTNGVLTVRNLSQFKPTKAFLSCHGVDESLEITDGNLHDAETKAYVLDLAKETFLVLDKTKLGASGVVKVADISRIDHVITEADGNPAMLEKLRQADTQLHLAGQM